MRILITGSNGLLGQKLVDQLTAANNHEVIATSRGDNRLPVQANYTYASLDITIEKDVLECVEKFKPEVVINTAAMTNVDQCENDKEHCDQLNVEAVKHLLKACESNNCFLLHLSTDFIFDGENGPYSEEDQANPVSYYGESKLKAEELIQNSPIDWAIARTILVYGVAHDMSRSNIILWVKESLEKNVQINVVNDQWRTPTLAEDLAKGCILIAEKKAKGIFNIAGKDLLTPYEMALKVAEYFNLDQDYINETDGSKFKQVAKRPPKTGLTLDKSKSVLDYKPVSFDEGISVVAQQIKK